MPKLTLEEAREYGWGDQAAAFMLWRNKMDDLVIKKAGLDLDCFPDWEFAGAFTSGMTPSEAASEFLAEQAMELGFDPDELGF